MAMIMVGGSAWADEETFTLNTADGIEEVTANKSGTNTSTNNIQGGDVELVKGDVTVTAARSYFKGSGSDGIQVYKTGSMTVSVPMGKKISKIAITLASSCFPFAEAPDSEWDLDSKGKTSSQQAQEFTISPSAMNVTFNNTSTGQTKVKKIVVTYATATDVVYVSGVSLDKSSASLLIGEKATLTATVSPSNASNPAVTWSTSDDAVAKVNAGVVTAVGVGNATITVTTTDGSKTASCAVTVSRKPVPEGAVFYETFDACFGEGGNDNVWSNITATYDLGTLDNEGWVAEGSVTSGSQCVLLRKAKNEAGENIPSGLTTPALGITGNATLVFNAESWGTDGSNFFVEIVGDGKFIASEDLLEDNISSEGDTAKVIMNKASQWKTFTLSVEGLTADSKIHLYAPATKRVFLDEVVVYQTSYTLTISAAEYATYYDSKNAYVMPEDCEGYVFTVAEGLELAYKSGETVPAGEPLVIYTIEPGTKTLTFTTSEEDTYKSGDMNDLEGTDEETALEADADSYFYALTLNAEGKNVGFYWMNETGAAFTNGAHKAYLKAAKTATEARGFAFNGATTAIKSITTSSNDKIYDFTGREVKSAKTGLYIVNGVKKFIK